MRDRAKPIRRRWYPAEVLRDMLLANPSHRDRSPSTDLDRRPEYLLAEEDPLRVVPQRPVLPRGEARLALVKPFVHGQVVVDISAPFADTAQRVVIWMCH
jgi:hypothetical protein